MTKYRGWSVEGKEWVYGYHCAIESRDYILPTYAMFVNGKINEHYCREVILKEVFTEVHPDSVGMFIGITDKGGKEIYGSLPDARGGDILKDGKGENGRVVYLPNVASFVVETQGEVCQYWSLNEGNLSNQTQLTYTEVIGNQWEEENAKG